MTKSDALFKLIKSLTPEEKKHFELFSTEVLESEGTSYMELYKKIKEYPDNQDYDENELSKKLTSEKLKSNISYFKNYLSNSILKSLRVYDAFHTSFLDVKKSILDIHFLFRKNHLNQALKKIRASKRKAKQHDFDLEYYELCLLERKVLCRTINKIKADIETINCIQEDSKTTLEKIEKTNHFNDLYEESFLNLKQNTRIPSQELQLFVEENSITSDCTKEHFHQAAITYLTYSNHYRSLKQYSECKNYLKKLILMFEERKGMIKEDKDRYINVLNNYLTYCIHLKDYNEFKKYLPELKEERENGIYLNNLITQHRNYLNCLYHIQSRQFKIAIKELFPMLEKWVKRNKNSMTLTRLNTYYYSFAVSYFMVKDYDTSRKWCLKVMNEVKSTVRDLIKIYIHFIYVLNLHELKAYGLLEPEIISLRKTLRKMGRYGEGEQEILKTILKSSTVNKTDRKKLFKDLKQNITNLNMSNSTLSFLKQWIKNR